MPNSPIPPAQHARNKAPLWRFLTGEVQEGAVPDTHPPGISHFPEKTAALFHIEGKTRERRRVRNASPPAGKGARHGRANIRMQQLLRGFQQGAHHRGDVDPMPLLRRQIISVLAHDETGRTKATQSQTRNAHRPPKMNGAESATRPTAYFPARPTTPRRLAGIEREARPRDNATVFYPPAKAASVFQKNQPPFSM